MTAAVCSIDEPVVPDPGGGGLVRLRLDLGYDGTAFSGWATQPGLRTVQGVLEQALAQVLRIDPPRLTVAGRTDAGVHARGQVAHVDLDPDAWARLVAVRPPRTLPAGGATEVLRRRLAGVLPADVRVAAVRQAPAGFDARFSALWRRYAYRVCDDPAGVDPLRRHDVLAHRRPLDLTAMDEASAHLLGEHDFAAFCRFREGATTVRTLLDLHWERDADGIVVGTVRADAFCHSMVRALVGGLLPVGDGRRPADWPGLVLAGLRRDPAVTVVGPQGLTLEEVAYPGDDELADRARTTRARRDRPGEQAPPR